MHSSVQEKIVNNGNFTKQFYNIDNLIILQKLMPSSTLKNKNKNLHQLPNYVAACIPTFLKGAGHPCGRI
jgi:hypothetical protein